LLAGTGYFTLFPGSPNGYDVRDQVAGFLEMTERLEAECATRCFPMLFHDHGAIFDDYLTFFLPEIMKIS
jgi:hypothetical protein